MKFIIAILAFIFKSLKTGAIGIWAIITAFVDYITYAIFVKAFGFSIVVSNILSWIIAETFAFFSNKVFKYKGRGNKLVLKEYIKFFLARIFIVILETVILKLTVDIFGFEELKMKVLAMAIVLLITWPINRFIVFNKSEYKSLIDILKNIIEKKNKGEKK